MNLIKKILFYFNYIKFFWKDSWGLESRKELDIDQLIVVNSRRSSVVARKGMVATSQPLAVEAGLEILRKGGNAADAAVAAAAVLNVTEPTAVGVGGDCFAIYYDATTKKVSALNGSGRTPAALTLEKAVQSSENGRLKVFHPHTITVPGAVAGWCDLVEKLGKLSMSEILAPAINLAEEGFPVEPITASTWAMGVKRQLDHTLNGRELTIKGRAPRAGETFRNLGLARTLKLIAEGGKEAFYRGEIGEAIIEVIRKGGGVMDAIDLAEHTSTWETPINTSYKGFRVWECPPNGQGLAVLLALNILESFDLADMNPLSPLRLHLEIEAMRIAFTDTRYFVADPATNPAPLRQLLSKSYAVERRKLLNIERATIDQKRGTPTSSTDTAYLSVVDGDGNACSFINSKYWGFGSGIIPKGWGFTLQNRGYAFSLEKGHPNVLASRKRPYHTIIPSMITNEENDDLFASFGIMGGFMQPQGQVQLALSLMENRKSPQSTLNLPRFCIQDGNSGGKVLLERGMTIETIASLELIGHEVIPVRGLKRSVFGRGQIILKDQNNGNLIGGSDPRADGMAGALSY